MRCDNCNKFVSYDEAIVEVQNVEVGADNVVVQATVTLPCAECGTELAQAEVEGEAAIEHVCLPANQRTAEFGWNPDWKPDPDFKEEDEEIDQFRVLDDSPDAEGTTRMETTDRKGKPINPRYAKTFHGFTTEVSVRCRRCGAEFDVTVEGEEQASAYESVQ